MPKKARLYIGIIVALGFALLAGTLIWFREFPEVARYLACLSLACIASTMKVRLPGLHGTISVNFVFILMALTQLSPRALPGQGHLLIALAPAAVVFFVMNTGMVSLVLALLSESTLPAIWKRCHLWAFPYYLVGAAIVALIDQASETVGWRLSLLALPMMYLAYSCYKLYVSSHEARTRTS